MNKEIAKAFCDECSDAFANWATIRIAFENVPSQVDLPDDVVLESPIGECIYRVYGMCLEAWISQVVRLDDPKTQNRNENLSIHRICEAEEWSGEERTKIVKLLKILKALPERLRPARNKIISHNDLATHLENVKLGNSLEGLDDDYFKALEELATMTWEKWCKADADFLERNRVFIFNLKHLENDEFSATCQAIKLRDCLCEGLREHL